MAKILIIHHLEQEWESAYIKHGTSFFELSVNFIEHIENGEYDRVILTRFDDYSLGNEHQMSGIANYIDQVETYGYGWCNDDVLNDDTDEDWVEGGTHSEYVWLAPWMRDLNGEIFISGAFDGECVEDLEIALNALNIEFTRLEELIV